SSRRRHTRSTRDWSSDVCSSDLRIFKQRNVDIGVVSLADAWAWGFSGVMVRGSGAAWDLRKAQPYECYSEFDFDIPIGKNGDNRSEERRVGKKCNREKTTTE